MKTIAHIVSHTHWDREWYLNSPYTVEWLVPFFDELFRLLDAEKEYRFVLDGQSCMIDDYRNELRRIGRDPAEGDRNIRRFVSEGRLVVGPYYLQPDWNLAGDEALVRNLLIGTQDADALGGTMRVGWLLDNFGQISQTAQLHRGFGIEGLFVWRGVEPDPQACASEFLWKAPDGSEVFCVYLIASYRNGMRLAGGGIDFARRVRTEVEKIRPFAGGPNVLLMNGYDQETEPENVQEMIRRAGGELESCIPRQSTPEEYVAALRETVGNIPVYAGALYGGSYISVFPGVLSARVYLKTANDLAQRLVERFAEPLAAMAWLCGAEYPRERLRLLWKRLLRNHPHDSICGVSIDDVHRDMERRLEAVRAEAVAVAEESAAAVAASLDSEGGRPALLALNPTPFPRRQIVRLSPGTADSRDIHGAQEEALHTQESVDGGLFVALPAMPGFGYEALVFGGGDGTPRGSSVPEDAVRVGERSLENGALRITISSNGTLEVLDKRTGNEYGRLGLFEDGADNGDSYDYSYPKDDLVVVGSRVLSARPMERGPLVGSLELIEEMEVPAALTPDRSSRSQEKTTLRIRRTVSLRSEEAMVRMDIEVENTAEDHRLRMLLPLGAKAGRSFAGAPFDIVEWPITAPSVDQAGIPDHVRRVIIGARSPKPVSIFPFKRGVGIAAGKRGIALSAGGLSEYEVIGDGTTLAVTLFRSIGWLARSDLATRIGDAGPAIAVPDGQCLRRLSFSLGISFSDESRLKTDLCVLPEVFNDAYALVPFRMEMAAAPLGRSFISVSATGCGICWSAVKLAEKGDSLVVRIGELTHRPGQLKLRSDLGSATFFPVRLDEGTLEPGADALRIGGGEIKTLEIRVPERTARKKSSLPAETSGKKVALPVGAPSVGSTLMREERLHRILQEEAARADALSALREQALEGKGSYISELDRIRKELEEAGTRRSALEARLSVLLLRKRLMSGAQAFEPELRSVGMELNKARIDKRMLEYVLDSVCAPDTL